MGLCEHMAYSMNHCTGEADKQLYIDSPLGNPVEIVLTEASKFM